jgi:hypothetical protein
MNRTDRSLSKGTIYATRHRRRRQPVLVLATGITMVVATAAAAAVVGLARPEPARDGAGELAGPDTEAAADYQILTPPVALEPVSSPAQAGPAGVPLNQHTGGTAESDPPAGGPLQPHEPAPPAPEPPPQQAPAGNPCEGAEPAGLAVSPDPLQLAPGAYQGSFAVHNCGPAERAWSTASKPSVTLSPDVGTLAGGESVDVDLTVDRSAFPTGSYTFKIKVFRPGQSIYLDVHGSALAVAQAPSPEPSPGGLTGNHGPAGCAAGCITKAWLTPSPSGTGTTLEVRTHTAARIVAMVGAGAEAITANTGGAYRTEWTTTFAPLVPGTTYPVQVSATDADGNVATESGSFTTPAPVTGLSAGEPGGCATGCVKTAQLTPQPGVTDQALAVSTQVPTRMEVFVDDRKPETNQAGLPHFPLKAPMTSSGDQLRTDWTATLTGLDHAKRYHVILKVTDEQGRSQFHTGSFKTPPKPAADHQHRVLVTFYKIRVTADGDNGRANKTGELRFKFAIGDQHRPELDTDERKVRSPETVSLDDGDRAAGRAVVIENAPDQLWIRVQGWERDRKRRNGLNQAAAGTPPPWPSAPPLEDEVAGESRDSSKDWNTAIGLVDLHQLANPDNALPDCHGFAAGANADICAELVVAEDSRAPRFVVFFSIHVLD